MPKRTAVESLDSKREGVDKRLKSAAAAATALVVAPKKANVLESRRELLNDNAQMPYEKAEEFVKEQNTPERQAFVLILLQSHLNSFYWTSDEVKSFPTDLTSTVAEYFGTLDVYRFDLQQVLQTPNRPFYPFRYRFERLCRMHLALPNFGKIVPFGLDGKEIPPCKWTVYTGFGEEGSTQTCFVPHYSVKATDYGLLIQRLDMEDDDPDSECGFVQFMADITSRYPFIATEIAPLMDYTGKPKDLSSTGLTKTLLWAEISVIIELVCERLEEKHTQMRRSECEQQPCEHCRAVQIDRSCCLDRIQTYRGLLASVRAMLSERAARARVGTQPMDRD